MKPFSILALSFAAALLLSPGCSDTGPSGPASETVSSSLAQGCSVTCNSGYYACCKDHYLGLPTCTCKKDGTEAECTDGGPNSSSCSMSQ